MRPQIHSGYPPHNGVGALTTRVMTLLAGRTFTLIDAGMKTWPRYGAFPSKDVWYLTGGTFPVPDPGLDDDETNSRVGADGHHHHHHHHHHHYQRAGIGIVARMTWFCIHSWYLTGGTFPVPDPGLDDDETNDRVGMVAPE
jgi:hypothetical protein